MTTLPAFDELRNIRNDLGLLLYGMALNGRFDRKKCEDIIFELLTMGYVYGITVAGLDLEEDIPVDRERMKEVIWQPTAGETFAERITDHVDAANEALATDPMAKEAITDLLESELGVLTETETHRVINEAIMDGAAAYAEAHPDELVTKTWVTMADDRVRDTHWYLEGVTVPLDALFYTYDNDSAYAPGGFELTSNNCNCRCVLRLRKRVNGNTAFT